VYTLLLDGTKREISFPYPEGEKGNREWPPAMADTGIIQSCKNGLLPGCVLAAKLTLLESSP